MRIIDMQGRPLDAEVSLGGYQLEISTGQRYGTRQLDRSSVRQLLDEIASSPRLRLEMRDALDRARAGQD